MSTTNTSTPTKRIEYIDALRGFTMILVVFSHVLLFSLDIKSSFINEVFISFRMPLFFFISGFIGYKGNVVWNKQTWWVMSKKKILIQLLPTLVFGLIYTYSYRNLDLNAFAADNMKLGYWFTVVLLEMFLLMYTINAVLFNKNQEVFKLRILYTLIICAPLLFFVSFLPNVISQLHKVFNLFSLYQMFRFFLYFAFGYICSMYKETFNWILENKYFSTAIIIAFVVLFGIDYFYVEQYVMTGCKIYGIHINYFDIMLTKIIGFFGLLIVYNTFRVYKDTFTSDKQVGKVLQYIGKRTLDIYLLHYFFLPYIPEVGSMLSNEKNAVLELTIGGGLSLIVIGICLVVSNVLRTSPILAKYLFGAK